MTEKKFDVKYIDLATGKTVKKTITEVEQYALYKLQREGKISIISINVQAESNKQTEPLLFPRLRQRMKERRKERTKRPSSIPQSKPPPTIKPESGKTFHGQSDEAYCLECVEGHTMAALTEMRHAVDRFRTAGKMTEGVTEKVRVAIGELLGINEDARNTKKASPEVKKGLDEILNEARWIRKDFGMSGKGLTRGYGTKEDLEELRNRILILQNKAYKLVENCPTCKVR